MAGQQIEWNEIAYQRDIHSHSHNYIIFESGKSSIGVLLLLMTMIMFYTNKQS